MRLLSGSPPSPSTPLSLFQPLFTVSVMHMQFVKWISAFCQDFKSNKTQQNKTKGGGGGKGLAWGGLASGGGGKGERTLKNQTVLGHTHKCFQMQTIIHHNAGDVNFCSIHVRAYPLHTQQVCPACRQRAPGAGHTSLRSNIFVHCCHVKSGAL